MANDHLGLEDDLLWVLYARALRRKGEGYPRTDAEIRRFEASCNITTDDRRRFAAKLQRIKALVEREVK